MTLSSENNLVRKIVKFWVSWKTSQLANLWLKLWLFMFVAKKYKQFGFLNDSSLNQNSFSDFHKHKLLLSTGKKNIWISFCNSSFRSSFGDIPPKTGGVDGRGLGGQSGMVAIHPTSGKISHSNPTTSESMSYSTIMPSKFNITSTLFGLKNAVHHYISAEKETHDENSRPTKLPLETVYSQ